MTPDERLLTPDEVAERLALSPQTVGDMLRAGDLPGQKLGGRLWRVRAADLDDFIRLGSEAWAEKRAEKRRTGSRAAVGQPTRREPLAPRWPSGKPKPAKPAPAARKAKPAPAADPSAGLDAEPPENREPTEAERVAWASIGMSEEDDVYTPEYRAWLETQAAAPADPDDEGGTS